MDNLWLYLILIFGYVGYLLVKGARKQRNNAQEHDGEEVRREHDESPRSLDEVWQQLAGVTPPPMPKKQALPREHRRTITMKPAIGKSAGHTPFLSGELAGAMAPAAQARESFRRKVEGAMPETVALQEERAATAGSPTERKQPADVETELLNEENPAPFTTPEEWRRAFIASEIWNRKY